MKFFMHNVGVIVLLSINFMTVAQDDPTPHSEASQAQLMPHSQLSRERAKQRKSSTPPSSPISSSSSRQGVEREQSSSSSPAREQARSSHEDEFFEDEETPKLERRASMQSLSGRSDISGSESKHKKNTTTALVQTSAPVARIQEGLFGSIFRVAESYARYTRTVVETSMRDGSYINRYPTSSDRSMFANRAIEELIVEAAKRKGQIHLLRAKFILTYANENDIEIFKKHTIDLDKLTTELIQELQEFRAMLSTSAQ